LWFRCYWAVVLFPLTRASFSMRVGQIRPLVSDHPIRPNFVPYSAQVRSNSCFSFLGPPPFHPDAASKFHQDVQRRLHTKDSIPVILDIQIHCLSHRNQLFYECWGRRSHGVPRLSPSRDFVALGFQAPSNIKLMFHTEYLERTIQIEIGRSPEKSGEEYLFLTLNHTGKLLWSGQTNTFKWT
jgi:hypothetical protein